MLLVSRIGYGLECNQESGYRVPFFKRIKIWPWNWNCDRSNLFFRTGTNVCGGGSLLV